MERDLNNIQSVYSQLPFIYLVPKERNQIIKDINILFDEFSHFSIKISLYTFENGLEKKIIQIFGTINIKYKQRSYNIPVNIWILSGYPRIAPHVYVTPTAQSIFL